MTHEPAVRLHTPTANTSASDPAPEAHAMATPANGKRLIRLADLFAQLNVSKPTGHRLIAAGKIGPRAIRLTAACVRFSADEVDAWLSARKPDGNLHDAKSWPPIWEMIQRNRK